jgi:Protein of unknown function (DUF732)
MNTNDPNYGKWSNDGTHWWDGEAWQPQPQGIEPVEESGPDRKLTYIIAGLVATILVLFAGLGAVMLADRGDVPAAATPVSTPRPTPTYEPPAYTPPPPSSPSKEDLALELMRDRAPELNSVPDSTIKDLMHAQCEGLDNGLTIDQIIGFGLDTGLSPQAVGSTLGAAIAVYCPQYQAALEAA